MSTRAKEQYNVQTPLKCPICGKSLKDTMIRELGSVTPKTVWQLHAGRCEDHGWFQAEVVGKPPRDIFAVSQPFGASRRLLVDGKEVYQFPTVWNDVSLETRMNKYDPVDPLDAQYWEPRATKDLD